MNSANPSAEDIIATLRANEARLRQHSIVHAALFGSRARGDNRPDSDIDILIETEAGALRTVYDYAGVKLLIADLFPLPADVINRAFLKPSIRPVERSEILLMHSEDTEQAALLDIRDNIMFAQSLVSRASYEAFRDDRVTFYAATRCLEIISEASRRPGPDVKTRQAQIAWRKIAAAGNIYRHSLGGGDDVSDDLDGARH
jgi:hypothetical protein